MNRNMRMKLIRRRNGRQMTNASYGERKIDATRSKQFVKFMCVCVCVNRCMCVCHSNNDWMWLSDTMRHLTCEHGAHRMEWKELTPFNCKRIVIYIYLLFNELARAHARISRSHLIRCWHDNFSSECNYCSFGLSLIAVAGTFFADISSHINFSIQTQTPTFYVDLCKLMGGQVIIII